MKTTMFAMALLFVMACGKELPQAPPPAGGSGSSGSSSTASEVRAFIVAPGYSQADALTAFHAVTPAREVWADRRNGSFIVFTADGTFSQSGDGSRTAVAASAIDVGYALVYLTAGRFDHAESKLYPAGWQTTPPGTHPTVASIVWCGGTYQAVCP